MSLAERLGSGVVDQWEVRIGSTNVWGSVLGWVKGLGAVGSCQLSTRLWRDSRIVLPETWGWSTRRWGYAFTSGRSDPLPVSGSDLTKEVR